MIYLLIQQMLVEGLTVHEAWGMKLCEQHRLRPGLRGSEQHLRKTVEQAVMVTCL